MLINSITFISQYQRHLSVDRECAILHKFTQGPRLNFLCAAEKLRKYIVCVCVCFCLTLPAFCRQIAGFILYQGFHGHLIWALYGTTKILFMLLQLFSIERVRQWRSTVRWYLLFTFLSWKFSLPPLLMSQCN